MSWVVSIFAIVPLTLISAFCGSSLSSIPVSESTPVWNLRLHEAGYPADNFGNEPNDFAAPRQITFLDAGTLAVSFTTSQYSPTGKLRYAAHVVIVDTPSGKVRNLQQWECPASCRPYVFANSVQSLIVADHGSIRLYDSSMRVIRDLALPPGNRIVQISPDGRTLGREGGKPGGPTLAFLDAETLDATGVTFVSNVRSISNQMMVEDMRPVNSRKAAISIRSPKGPEVLFRTTCGEALPHFLSEQTLLVTHCNQLSVITNQGQTLFSAQYPGTIRFAAVARNGNRFAISVTAYRGWDPPVLADELLIVFDLKARKPIFTVRPSQLPYMQSLAALSPDGSLFVTGSRGELQLHRLR